MGIEMPSPRQPCGSPVAEIWPFAYVGGIWNPHFGERGGRRGSAMAPLERAMVVSYRLFRGAGPGGPQYFAKGDASIGAPPIIKLKYVLPCQSVIKIMKS